MTLLRLYGLSVPQLELQVADGISFRVFLGTTETISDYTTVWLFLKIYQLRAKGYDVKEA